MTGKQVLLYLVDGQPGGLRTAEVANWTGHVVAAPRSELGRLLSREESRRTGVYLLLGDDLESGQAGGSKIYIGEGDEVATRLRKHQIEKDWWDRVVIVTSQGQAQQLTKSQVRYIESQLISRAHESARATLTNGTDPAFARLSEAETSNMDYFLDQLDVLLPAIGVDAFRGAPTVPSRAAEPIIAVADAPKFFIRAPKRNLEASACVIDGEFVVLAGSTGAAAIAASETHTVGTARAYSAYRTVHAGLLEKNSLVVEGSHARFLKNVPFSSPSTAGAIVLGRSCNGRKEWINADGVSYGEWESRGVADGFTENEHPASQ